MSVYMNADISYLVGDIEVACNAKSVVFDASCTELDTTALCTTGWRTYIAGLHQASFSVSAMADMADLGLDATLAGYFATADVPQSLSIGSADGSVTYFTRGMISSFVPVEGAVGDLAMTSISGKSSTGPLVRGVRAHPTDVARSATGNGTAYQLGALSASQTLYASLHVLARTGTASMTLKVQSDDNGAFSSATDRITSFTAATGRTYQWGSVAGAVTDDYWRCVYTITGTGTITFGVSLGIAATF
jgi:hypothetical protein